MLYLFVYNLTIDLQKTPPSLASYGSFILKGPPLHWEGPHTAT